jgi:DNA transformation protein and related proteins
MPVSAGFQAFVVEQLGRVASDIRARSMFGGVGIYAGENFFALIYDDTLYFKVDDTTRSAYTARGMEPFRPYGDKGGTMQYYQVAEDLLDDAEALQPWVVDAIAVRRRAKRKRRPGNRT